jgi:hypothetical protein
MRSALRRRFPSKRECYQRIGNFGAERSAPARSNNNKLFAGLLAQISDGSGVSVGFGCGCPQFFSVANVEGAETAVGCGADEYQAAAYDRAAQIWRADQNSRCKYEYLNKLGTGVPSLIPDAQRLRGGCTTVTSWPNSLAPLCWVKRNKLHH